MTQANSLNLSFDEADIARFQQSNLFSSGEFPHYQPLEPLVIYKNMEDYMHLEGSNPYIHMVDRASFFRRHGLTPLYMVDNTGFKMLVTSEEHYYHKLH